MVTEIDIKQANSRIRKSRERKHLLKELEFKTIEYLCPKIPSWVTPDILTFIGILGSVIVAIAMVFAIVNPYALVLAIIGFGIQWFGDSLDGRIAYYRNTPRKWYGWALDITADWISISVIGLGFYFYLPYYNYLAFIFVLAYGGSMILSLLRYKINNTYVIDKGILGPTEMRIIICLVLFVELITNHAMIPFMLIGSLIMIIINIAETKSILREGDIRDFNEKKDKIINATSKLAS